MWSDLKAVLTRYPAIARPSAEPEPLGNAGGLSGATLWRYPSGHRRLVARAWPVDGPPKALLERTHSWLFETAQLGFVPIPIRSADGASLIDQAGRLWEVGPWVDGLPDLAIPPEVVHVRAGFGALAAFHQSLARHQFVGRSPGLMGRFDEVGAWLARGFSGLERAIDGPVSGGEVDAARQWLGLGRSLAPAIRARLGEATRLDVAVQPCLRDVRPGHFLFEGDRLNGLIDFGAMGFESVSADIARLTAEWLGDDLTLRDEALRAYAAVRPLDARELALIGVFEDSAALLTGGRWASWHFVEGKPFADPLAVAHGLEKGLQRLTRLTSRS